MSAGIDAQQTRVAREVRRERFDDCCGISGYGDGSSGSGSEFVFREEPFLVA